MYGCSAVEEAYQGFRSIEGDVGPPVLARDYNSNLPGMRAYGSFTLNA